MTVRKSKIEWTDATWSPVRGCSMVSTGCENCYAMRMAHRFSGKGQPYEGLTRMTDHGPLWTGKVRCLPEELEKPLHWRKPARIFVCSMSDLFHDKVPDEFIAAVFGVMAACPNHTFICLTKRAKRMRTWFSKWVNADSPSVREPPSAVMCGIVAANMGADVAYLGLPGDWPLPNVWLGVSTENQAAADERIPELLLTPAAVRWVSAEPLLGPIDLRRVRPNPFPIDALTGGWGVDSNDDAHHRQEPRIHWVVVGAESGPGARPMDLDWARSLRDQCDATHTRYFLKQAFIDDKLVKTPKLDGKQWMQFPEVLP